MLMDLPSSISTDVSQLNRSPAGSSANTPTHATSSSGRSATTSLHSLWWTLMQAYPSTQPKTASQTTVKPSSTFHNGKHAHFEERSGAFKRTNVGTRLLGNNWIPGAQGQTLFTSLTSDGALVTTVEDTVARQEDADRQFHCPSSSEEVHHEWHCKRRKKKKPRKSENLRGFVTAFGGDGGIRTLDPGFGPDAPLAGECLRPLGHVSQTFARTREAVRREQDNIGFRTVRQFP